MVSLWQLRQRQVYDWLFAPGDLKDLMDQATLFDGIAAVRTGTAPLIVDGAPPQQVKTAFVTPNIFDVLGVKVVRGRAFTPEDGRVQPRLRHRRMVAPRQAHRRSDSHRSPF